MLLLAVAAPAVGQGSTTALSTTGGRSHPDDGPKPKPDVETTKTGPATVPVGGTISYTITVKNLGTKAATWVIVEDTLPNGVTFLSASGGGTLVGSLVRWPAIASLAPGASRSFIITVSVLAR